MTMTYPVAYPSAYYEGSPTSEEVGSMWPAALNGRGYMLDTLEGKGWSHSSLPLLRPQADQSSSPSEESLNPDSLWRRAADSFHGGAGQTYRDRGEGDATRFRSSKGVDPWTFYELGLLNDTDQKKTSANTNVRLVPAGSRLYCADGSTLTYTDDITVGSPTWNAVTYAGGTILSLCSDGYSVYLTDGSDIYVTTTADTTAVSTNSLDCSVLAFIKGRLMAAGRSGTKQYVYNITTIGTAPSALNAPLDANFSWVGFADGPAHIYCAGYSGDKSLIYRIAIRGDGTTLDPPVQSGELPDGEIIRSVGGYLGFIVLGTSAGVRFCEADNQGNLVIGAAFGGSPCYAFEGQDRFVWFGWDNYDSSSTGLGRMSLQTFTENFVTGARVPAYASDLMVTAQGSVLSIVTFQGIRVFTIASSGVWADSQTLVASGELKTGCIGFGIPDEKIAISTNVRTKPLDGSYAVALSVDEAASFTSLGIATEDGLVSTDFPIEDGAGWLYELQFTLTAVGGAGPTITRWTLKASPGATDTPAEYITAPILLREVLRLPGGQVEPCDVIGERERIKELRRTRRLVTYQEAGSTYTVQVEDFQWIPEGFTTDQWGAVTGENGVMLTKMKRMT